MIHLLRRHVMTVSEGFITMTDDPDANFGDIQNFSAG